MAAEGMEPISFALVSDTHLGRKDNLRAENNWKQAVKELNELDVEFIIHLGDIVDGGRGKQFLVYKEINKSLHKPIFEIPGNHDPVPDFEKHLGVATDRSFVKKGLRFLLFNNSNRDSHQGFVTEKQLGWIREQCETAKVNSEKIIFCCHVPFHTNKHPDRGWYVLPKNGQKEFYELVGKFENNVVASFHGHFHNGIRGWRDHKPLLEILCPSVCYNQDRNLKQHIADGKASGFFVDELRAGYVIAKIGNGKLELSYKPLKATIKSAFSSRQ